MLNVLRGFAPILISICLVGCQTEAEVIRRQNEYDEAYSIGVEAGKVDIGYGFCPYGKSLERNKYILWQKGYIDGRKQVLGIK